MKLRYPLMKKAQALRQTLGRMVFAILLLALSTQAQNLFLAGLFTNNENTIDEFINDNGTLNSNVTVFASALEGPFGLAFDSAGDLFAGERPDIIEKFTADGATNIVASGLYMTVGMAIDKSGNLFVASASAPGAIYEFSPAGAQRVFFTSATLGLGWAIGMAFDRNDDLFAAFHNDDIVEFTNNDGILSTNATIFASGLSSPAGLVFDSSGDLFVSCFIVGSAAPIDEFTNYNGTLSSNITIFASGLYDPYGMAFDSAGNMFVKVQESLSGGPTSILEITPSGVQTTFATGLSSDVTYLAFQPVPTLQGVATNGTFQITVAIPSPYYTTILQSSADLVNWCNLCTNTPPFTFTDSLAASSRFYRAVLDTNFY
jgi:glucose/arabinose dehydrogenase